MFTSLDVAAYIAQECDRHGYTYNNTKIQKLLYVAYGVMLAWQNERICDEYPRAWPYGPVFPKVFKFINQDGDIAARPNVLVGPNATNIRYVAQATVERFGMKSAKSLSTWSHATGSPWHRVVVQEDAGWNSFIPDEYIRDYFLQNVIHVQEPAHA